MMLSIVEPLDTNILTSELNYTTRFISNSAFLQTHFIPEIQRVLKLLAGVGGFRVCSLLTGSRLAWDTSSDAFYCVGSTFAAFI